MKKKRFKSDLVTLLSQEMGWKQKQSHDFITVFFQWIQTSLHHSQRIVLSGFGSFHSRIREPRRLRHPATSEWLTLSKRHAAHFSVAPTLIKQINISGDT